MRPILVCYYSFVLYRFGNGWALPMMITLASEAVPDQHKGTAVSVMYSGIPFGGLLTSVVAMSLAGDAEWRHIFLYRGLRLFY